MQLMTKMRLTILGSGSALPFCDRFNCCQILKVGDEKQYMIDCGEGAQILIRKMGLRPDRIGHIFISHLHGDHCFGLLPLISTMAMLGRLRPLTIHAHADLQKMLEPEIDYYCQNMSYEVLFAPLNPRQHTVVFEDSTVRVTSIPLKHSLPTCGFLFEEKSRGRHIAREKADFYKVPVCYFQKLRNGDDVTLMDGTVVKNEWVTTPADKTKCYAYCSDTLYREQVVDMVRGVNCLYHEATYKDSEEARAKQTNHSTSKQAAMIAKNAGVGQLIVGHFSSRYRTPEQLRELLEEAKSVFTKTKIAKDCSVFDF